MHTLEAQTQEKVLLSYRHELDEQLRGGASEKLPKLQALLDGFTAMFPELSQSTEALSPIVGIASDNDQYIETAIRRLIYSTNEQMKALPIPENTAITLINLPSGYGDFMDAVTKYRRFLSRVKDRFVTDIALEHFIVEDGQVRLSDGFEAFIDSKCASYATGEEAEVITELETVYEQLLALQAKYPSIPLVASFDQNKANNPVFWKGSGSGRLYFNKRAVRHFGK